MTDYGSALFECVAWHLGQWPEELTSGVMHWRGHRITFLEFTRIAKWSRYE